MNRYPHPADMDPDATDPRSPHYDPPESILDCPNETGTWLSENMAEEVKTAAIEIIGDWLASPRDGYAEAKLHREMMEFAGKCDDAIRRFEDLESWRFDND